MKIKKNVLLQDLGESFVAYDNAKQVLHELNEVGYLVLKWVKEGLGEKEMVEKLMEDFQVSEEEAEEDVEEFLEELESKDLIER